MQQQLFMDIQPVSLWVRCRCGYCEEWPVTRLELVTEVRAGAVSIWADCCPKCDPRTGFAPWGWVMPGGKRVPGI